VSEYDLICDVCGQALEPALAIVSWTKDGPSETGFTLAHAEHVPQTATDRAEVRRLMLPNEFLRFLADRLGRNIADPAPLRAIAWGLAPFVMRHDNPAEMDSMRAASFGQRPGVKPGTTGGAEVSGDRTPAKATEVEGGK
jgi:hypothetical protein